MYRLRHIKLVSCVSFLFFFIITQSQSQTFTNNTVAVANSWNATLTRTISVSGLTGTLGSGNIELIQVNLHMGSQADGSYNYSHYKVTLQSPTGNIITLIQGGNFVVSSFPSSPSVKEFNTKFRDNAYLQLPTSGSSSQGEPWHIGYYRTYTANDFSAFNGQDPNGNWVLTITEDQMMTNGARFNKVDLIFGNLNIIDYTSYKGNDSCETPYCLRPSEIVIGTNNGFTPQIPDDMWDSNTSGCIWNQQQNNSAWYKFVAVQPDVHITISGISGNLQILGISSAGLNPCLSADNAVVSGGCPIGLPNDTYKSPRYNNGSNNNNQLIMSGLTLGETYYFIVDGVGGAISPFYIEISSGASDACEDVLPVEMLYFYPEPNINGTVELFWATASEKNNDYFLVQHSPDGVLFEPFSVVHGNGTTNTISYYNDIHYYPVSGTNYYRLKQVDYDGVYEYSNIISANIIDAAQDIFLCYDMENSLIEIFTTDHEFEVQIINISGQIVYRDRNNKTINVRGLTNGVYVLVVSSESGIYKDKLVVY